MKTSQGRKKLNGDLLTEEETNLPLGLGHSAAAERLGLIYLWDIQAMKKLLLEFGNEAWTFSATNKLTAEPFWKAMNQKADKLAAILKGKNPAYMAAPWFTERRWLRDSLYAKMEKVGPNDPPDAVWRKDPIRYHARKFMEFFLDLYEGAVEGQGEISNEQLAADHFRKYTGDFMGMDPAMVPLELGMSGGAENNATEAGCRQETPAKARPIQIVAVNSEPMVLEVLKCLLQDASEKVALKLFANSDDAWQELLREDPDLFITSNAMPGLRGEEICQRLLERKVTYRIVVMSAWSPAETWVREFAGQGLNVTYLAMPFEVGDFQKALGRFGEYVVVGKQDKEAHGSAIDWFIGKIPNPPKREDGTINFESLCGEFLLEGESYDVVRKHYDALPSELKRDSLDQIHDSRIHRWQRDFFRSREIKRAGAAPKNKEDNECG